MAFSKILSWMPATRLLLHHVKELLHVMRKKANRNLQAMYAEYGTSKSTFFGNVQIINRSTKPFSLKILQLFT